MNGIYGLPIITSPNLPEGTVLILNPEWSHNKTSGLRAYVAASRDYDRTAPAYRTDPDAFDAACRSLKIAARHPQVKAVKAAWAAK